VQSINNRGYIDVKTLFRGFLILTLAIGAILIGLRVMAMQSFDFKGSEQFAFVILLCIEYPLT
jgi:hypothetical protein